MSSEVQVPELLKSLSVPLAPIPTDEVPALKKLSGIRALVFDVYGTLLCSGVGDISTDQATDREPALRAAIEALGFKLLDAKTRLRALWVLEVQVHQSFRRDDGVDYPEVDIRLVWKTFLERLLKQGLIEGVFDESMLDRISVEYECRVNPAWPMPGFAELLAALRSARMPLGIISNAQFFTPLLLESLAGGSLANLGFEVPACVWSYQLLEAKPSTSLYELAAHYWKESHGLNTHEILYVGNDLLNDIWPAQQVGFKTALFAGDARSLRWRKGDKRIAGVRPDIVLTELKQIGSCIA